jgi:hypothetical protein
VAGNLGVRRGLAQRRNEKLGPAIHSALVPDGKRSL